MIRRPPGSTRLPCTTLFRSERLAEAGRQLRVLVELPALPAPREPAAGAQAGPDRPPGRAGPERPEVLRRREAPDDDLDRKSTRLNSSHPTISYAVFCL